MIGALRGSIVGKKADRIILDVQGVGYEVMIPSSAYSRIPENGSVIFYVHTHVCEDSFQQELSQIVLTNNLQRLTSIQGIGKKTAERLLLELKEKIQKLSSVVVASDMPLEPDQFRDLVSALSNLGYKQIEIDRALSYLKPKMNVQTKFEDLLKQSLQFLRG
ncbi:MAG: Holliday junction branch migration protein RuvA [Deltaproteobacteria bacterium]|nr:Holliday junction branch migration protein RuvA [Deltaproteobacteria bacterium]